MTSYFQLRSRYRQIYLLFFLIALVVFGFWLYELQQSLATLAQREEDILQKHQELLLERKSENLRDLFHELYQTTRTISLLPMVQSVRGENRLNDQEDVVAQRRLSLDAHRTLQQIYTNLQNNVRVSEVYFVIDGFDPARNVPFFMYDELIASDAHVDPLRGEDIPPEVEDEEYQYFPRQLSWFREHAPMFVWTHKLDEIPVRLSPLMRTCDNSQFVSLRSGDVADTRGLIYAMPVYALDSGKFKGMITAVLRTNALEALLVDVPFIPVTREDERIRVRDGWQMPPPSAFVLRQADYGIEVHDRRNALLAEGLERKDGRWLARKIDLKTGGAWELGHYLAPDEIRALIGPVDAERQRIVAGRVLLLLLLGMGGLWNFVVLNRTRRELIAMAHFDPLTALPNRRLFLDQLERGLARSHRHQHKLALLLLDVSNFNAINDTYGTQGGDQLLVALGACLQNAIRGSDSVNLVAQEYGADGLHAVARLGGDQFTVICEDIASADDISAVLARLHAAISQPFDIGGDSMEISMSIGVAVYPDDAPDSDKLLICADAAMNESRKEALPFFLFNDQLRQHSERTHRLSLELKRALERGEYELFYQPKASLHDGRIVSLEALLRWRHPQYGLVSPVEFIPILERSGDIIAVGKWVIEQACRDLVRLADESFPSVMISANVSVRQLRRGNLHETVAEILTRTAVEPQRLVLEVTESMVMENLEEGRQALLQLDRLGIKLAIDDFGTGYSSLTYLQQLPLTYLKLDKAFIDAMDLPRSQHIVETVIYLAKGLSLKTIAEGIETVEQRDTLAAIGCDIIQGYLLSKPQPLAKIIAWMKRYQWEHRPPGSGN